VTHNNDLADEDGEEEEKNSFHVFCSFYSEHPMDVLGTFFAILGAHDNSMKQCYLHSQPQVDC
jgi:hypothetical protein